MCAPTEEIKIACPHCGQHILVETSMLGTELECPACGKTFTPPEIDSQTKACVEGEIDDAPNQPEGDETSFPETEEALERETETSSAPVTDTSSKANGLRAVFKRIRIAVATAAKSTFAKKVLVNVKTTMKWTVARLSRAFVRIDSWLATRSGATGADGATDSHKRKWLTPGICLALLVVVLGIFALSGDGGVALSLDEIAEKTAKYASRPVPTVNGKTLEFNGRLSVGRYDIPLEKQSRRISFDFRSTGTTGVESGHTSVKLFTCDAADAVFITIKDDGIFVQSRRDNSDKAVKVSVPSSRWKHVEAVMKPGETVVSVSGKKIVFPAMEGVRWASFSFTILKPNLQVKNVRSFPSKNARARGKEEKQLAEEKSKRAKEHAEYQRSRGLVLVDGEWMTPGSRRNISLSVIQKLLNRGTGISTYRTPMMRAPMYGEHGGLLCVDSSGGVGCIIVSNDEWHDAVEDRTYRFDIYRCGIYSYTTTQGRKNTVPLFATDLDTALEELDGGEHSARLK